MKAKTRLQDVYNKDAYVPFSIDGLQGAILLDELVNDPQLKEWYDAILTNGGMIQNIGGEQLADDSYKLVVTTLNTTGTTSEKEFIIGKATADALLLETETREQADTALEAKITEEKNARIAKDDVVFTVTKDTINDAETVGDAKWAWALTPSVSDEELNARIAKRANFYVDVSLDTLGFLPYLKYIKLESIPENKDGVFSALIPPASEFGYVETTNIKVKYNAKHKRWIALFYGADYIIPTVTSKKNGLMSKSDKATLDALPTQLTAEQTARVQADKTLQTNIDALKATATADANGLMSKEDKVKLDTKVATKEDIAKERTAREEADKVLTANLAKEVTDRTNAVNAEATAREQADTAINGEIQGIKDKGSLFDLFKAAGATLNSDGTTWSMNEVTDLTSNDLIYSILNPTYIYSGDSFTIGCNNSTKLRTNILNSVPRWANCNISYLFNNSTKIETIRLALDYNILNYVGKMDDAFSYCYKLRKILNPLNLVNIKEQISSKTFIKCVELSYIRLLNLKVSITFPDSPNLNKDSIVYMIKEAKPSSPITITLHPTAYAMATADPEIQAELEKQPNISLAEGEPTA